MSKHRQMKATSSAAFDKFIAINLVTFVIWWTNYYLCVPSSGQANSHKGLHGFSLGVLKLGVMSTGIVPKQFVILMKVGI